MAVQRRERTVTFGARDTPGLAHHYTTFSRYYDHFYAGSGDREVDNVYHLEANLYDLFASEPLLWSAQTQTLNPDDAESMSQDYARALIDDLVLSGALPARGR